MVISAGVLASSCLGLSLFSLFLRSRPWVYYDVPFGDALEVLRSKAAVPASLGAAGGEAAGRSMETYVTYLMAFSVSTEELEGFAEAFSLEANYGVYAGELPGLADVPHRAGSLAPEWFKDAGSKTSCVAGFGAGPDYSIYFIGRVEQPPAIRIFLQLDSYAKERVVFDPTSRIYYVWQKGETGSGLSRIK